MLSADVFVAIIGCAGASRSISANSASLRSMRSGAASMTKSASSSASSSASGRRSRREDRVARQRRVSFAELDALAERSCSIAAARLRARFATRRTGASRSRRAMRRMRDPVPHRAGAEHGDGAESVMTVVEADSTRRRTAPAISSSASHRVVDLVLGVVEMRRDADARARPVVDDDVSRRISSSATRAPSGTSTITDAAALVIVGGVFSR